MKFTSFGIAFAVKKFLAMKFCMLGGRLELFVLHNKKGGPRGGWRPGGLH
jgi:hypothetical protein